ncbi:MAG: hypothetical protein DWQ34_24960 [Planctomycetota bacterium]|nr:MAG: hypothetical protein DWQ29_09480 [Planctomycetota bacterium]REJ87471.1 MAG: hypothetical protein DWQ34_24960 [Planctomycetota bacterium]REK24439.1 MAG: hypothetical protein DWQ41_15600 [Planctomycetota bacterium]REK38628.1 MAG: hypothetical protein DWQ45_04385 [Planctomycetota bacterium]
MVNSTDQTMTDSGNIYPRWIRRSLVVGGGFAFVCLVSGALWKLLAAMGDAAGAQGARSVTVVAALGWAACIVAMVVLLACDRILRDNEDRG